MKQSLRQRYGILASMVSVLQLVNSTAAFAVPSNREAWSSVDQQIKVYKDEDEASGTYWFRPKLRFESKDGKTYLRTKVHSDGSKEYYVRIIPYFSKDLRELVLRNLPDTRQAFQLKPIVAKRIGIELPNFDFMYQSALVTDMDYLDAPLLVRFTLSADDAEVFDMLYQDDLGVAVNFYIAYDGVFMDRMSLVKVSCKTMATELNRNRRGSVSGSAGKAVDVFAGIDVERAFLNSVSNSLNTVDVISKGKQPEMERMLQQVMNVCFEPLIEDDYGYGGYGGRRSGGYGDYDDEDKETDEEREEQKRKEEDAAQEGPWQRPNKDVDGPFTRKGTSAEDRDQDRDSDTGRKTGGNTGRRLPPDEDMEQDDEPSDDLPENPAKKTATAKVQNAINKATKPTTASKRGQLASGSTRYLTAMEREAAALEAIAESLSVDKAINGWTAGSAAQSDTGGLLPEVTAKARFRLKKTAVNTNDNAIVRNIGLKDTVQTTSIKGVLRDKEQKPESVVVKPLQDKTFVVKSENGKATPYQTKIFIKPGEQWSVNAAFIFNARSSSMAWKERQFIWDSTWESPDTDLYFRVGNGHWTNVKDGRVLIASDVVGGGELQFYLDRSSLYNKIPEELRTSKWMGIISPVYPLEGFLPQFTVQVSGRSITVK